MDFKILYMINELHNDILDKIMIFITNLGDAGIVWILLAIILLFMKKTRKCGILMIISMGIGVIFGNIILKNLIARPRPCWIDRSIKLLIETPKDYSFPSGHTLASFEAAIMIYLNNKKAGLISIIMACLIAFSRMYLFVHFPTDILGGAILGTVISILVYYGYKKIREDNKFKKEENKKQDEQVF